MELTSDVTLHGPVWARAINELGTIFKTRTRYSLYMLCIAIGIMYDQRINKVDDEGIEPSYIARNVLQNQNEGEDSGKLDFMFQAAILSTKTEQFTEEERLELAFGEEKDFNKMDFLTSFANFGVSVLVEHIGETIVESMENIKSFLTSTVEGYNFEIDAIPDEVWLDDYM